MAIGLLGATLLGGGMGLLGGGINALFNRKANKENAEQQERFAKEGIRWRVEDAKAAGIHPLYALGANTTSFSPSYVGDSGIGNSLSNMGQDVSRAMMAKATQPERDLQYEKTVKANTLLSMDLENRIKAEQLRKMQEVPPAMPVLGSKQNPYPEEEYYRDNFGNIVKHPSMEYAQAMQGEAFGPQRFWLKHVAMPEVKQFGQNIADLKNIGVEAFKRNLWYIKNARKIYKGERLKAQRQGR